jgi:hypothetical protein
MPSFVPPERARFYVQPNGLPVVVLTLDPKEMAAIDAPPLAADSPPPGSALTGWSVIAQETMTVVDGPGEQGFLIPVTGPETLEEVDRWAEASARVTGSFVVFSPPGRGGRPAASAAPGARGGFVRLVDEPAEPRPRERRSAERRPSDRQPADRRLSERPASAGERRSARPAPSRGSSSRGTRRSAGGG